MEIERLSSDEYKAREGLVYVDTKDTHSLYEKIAFSANLILVGPKGAGKSLSVAAFCARKKYPVVTFDCSEDVRRAQLIGMFILRGNETPFVLGPLTTAFEVANEMGHCVLILEEINALTPQCQKLLNGTGDFRRSIEVPEAKRVFRLREGAKLWVVGTMNNTVYGGVYQLNEDLKSRFRMIPVDYPDTDAERRILSETLGIKDKSVEGTHVSKLLTLAKETRQGSLDYALSTRDLVQVLEDARLVGIDKALWMLTGKYEGDTRSTIEKRIHSIFAINKTK